MPSILRMTLRKRLAWVPSSVAGLASVSKSPNAKKKRVGVKAAKAAERIKGEQGQLDAEDSTTGPPFPPGIVRDMLVAGSVVDIDVGARHPSWQMGGKPQQA